MLGGLADDADDALALDYLALHTDLLHRCTNLHSSLPLKTYCRSLFLDLRKYERTVIGDRHRVLEVGREPAVAGDRRPTVLQNLYVVTFFVDHRLDGKHHADLEPGSLAGSAEVG